MFEIEFYQLPNGTKPAEEFLDSLDTKMRAKALHSLSILEEFGNQLREPYSKQLEDGLFELRIKLICKKDYENPKIRADTCP